MTVAERLVSALRAFGNGLYRFTSHPVQSWEEREKAEQEALSTLREHPGFAVQQDVLMEEVRRLFEAFCIEQDDAAALKLHHKASAIADVIARIDGAVTAKERQAWMESMSRRQTDLLTIDRARRVDKQARASQRAQVAARP